MKKYLIIITAVIITIAIVRIGVLFHSSRQIQYEIMDQWTVDNVLNDGEAEPGNEEFVSKMLDINEEDAVRIAKEAWSSRYILDNFEIHYDKENERYLVYAWYMFPEDRFDCLMIKLFDDPDNHMWDNTCTTLIDKNTGAVLNMDGWGIAP